MFKVETMIFTNPSEHTIKLEALGFDAVAPGADVELPLALCAPYRTDNGSRGKSAVEGVAPQLRPKSDEDYKAWLEVPTPMAPQSKIVANAPRHLQPQPESPGVKQLREKAEAAKAKVAQQAASVPRNTVASPQTNVSAVAGKA